MWLQLKRKVVCIALLFTVLATIFAVLLPRVYGWSLSNSFTDTTLWQQYKVLLTGVNNPYVVTGVTSDTFQFYTTYTGNYWFGAYLWSVNSYAVASSTMSVNVTVPDSNEQYNTAVAGIALINDSISNQKGYYCEWNYHGGYILYLLHPRTGSSGATTYAILEKVSLGTRSQIANSTLGTIYNVLLNLTISTSTISAYYSTNGATWNLITSASLDANIPSNLYIMLGGYAEVTPNVLTTVRNFNGQTTTGASFDFTVSVNPTSLTIQQGASGQATVTVTLTSGTTQSVSLTASGLPSGATASFNPSSGNPTFQSTLTITVGASTLTGSYTVTITGTNSTPSISRSTTLSLTVTSSPPSGNTLIQKIQSLVSGVNWGESIDTVYAGYIVGAKTKDDLKNAWLALTDPVSVLHWASVLMKLGIEDQTKIKWALDNTVMLSNGLPQTFTYNGMGAFLVYNRGTLYAGLYYAQKYNYQTSKWNIQTAYNSFKYAVQHGMVPGAGVLWVYGDGTSYTISYGPRYYDEAAESLDVFLIFYDLGIQSAMDDAVSIWKWINTNLWTGNYYKYALNWDDLECEAGGFYQIIAKLWQRNPNIGYLNRLVQDMEYRFLGNRWNSPQWGGSTPYFAVLHAAYSNTQRRLQNTIMLWSSIMGVYNRYNSTEQQQVIDLLQGYSTYPNAAWQYLISSSGLYDATLNQFKGESDATVSNGATAYGTALIFFMGMVPQDGSLAVPLEEYSYEYKLNMFDPELFHLDLSTRTVTLSVFLPGSIKFIYGSTPVTQVFSKSGVWQVTFSSDWNSIVSATYVSALPSNRRYLGEIPISLVFTVAIYSSPMGVIFTVNGSSYVTPYEKTFNNGTVLQIEFPASSGDWTWNYWSDGVTSRTRTLTVTKDVTLAAYYTAPSGVVIQPPPVIIVPPQAPSGPASIDISNLPHLLALAFGMPDVVGQLILGIVLLLAVLLPIAVATRGNADTNVYLIVGIPIMVTLVALGWFPVWVLLVVVLVVSALWSGKIREWLT